MRRPTAPWIPLGVLLVGLALDLGLRPQRPMSLRVPLGDAVPAALAGYDGQNLELSDAERRVAGVTTYLLRNYMPSDTTDKTRFSVYVGYYESQTQGRTIHSPRNCLPGAGWEALASSVDTVATPAGSVAVNRYLIQNGLNRALVLYWYQGRSRVSAGEYQVKWDLLRDAAILGRTEEALARVVVPVIASEDEAFALATNAAVELIPALFKALPL